MDLMSNNFQSTCGVLPTVPCYVLYFLRKILCYMVRCYFCYNPSCQAGATMWLPIQPNEVICQQYPSSLRTHYKFFKIYYSYYILACAFPLVNSSNQTAKTFLFNFLFAKKRSIEFIKLSLLNKAKWPICLGCHRTPRSNAKWKLKSLNIG